MGRVYLTDVLDYERRAILWNTPVSLCGVGIRLLRMRGWLVPGGRGGEAVGTGDVERH